MTFVNFPYAAIATIFVGFVALIGTIIGVTWKLSHLLAPLPIIQQSLSDLNVKVGVQNGRVTRLEEWKIDHSRTAERMYDQIQAQLREDR